MSASEEQSQGPVIRDRRRIDPVTGLPREPAAPTDSTEAGSTQAGSTQAGSTQAGSTQAGSTQAGSTQADSAQAGTSPRGTGQPRPGKHAVSKPGSLHAETAGAVGAGVA